MKGSRFLARAAPVADAEEARRFVDSVKAEHRKASHVASAFRAGGTEGSSDDGEVSGTAGPPALARLVGAGLDGVVVAVVRYYGGTNLGKGGLVRAYGAAASAVLDAAEVVELEDRVRREVRVPTGVGSAVTTALGRAGFTVLQAVWGAEVVLTVEGPAEAEEAARAATLDATRGTSRWA
ncbi:MAG: YigZ family protein [Myxococcales bacterium]|nr:YigZ family protein [Myxococcales bacterium]